MVLEDAVRNIKEGAKILMFTTALSLGAVGIAQGQGKLQDFFACTSIKGTGTSQSYAGIKNVFSVKEPMVLVDHDSYPLNTGDKEILEIFDPSGKSLVSITTVGLKGEPMPVVTLGEEPIEFFGSKYTLSYFLSNLAGGGYGKYKAVWTLNGRKSGETEFTITE